MFWPSSARDRSRARPAFAARAGPRPSPASLKATGIACEALATDLVCRQVDLPEDWQEGTVGSVHASPSGRTSSSGAPTRGWACSKFRPGHGNGPQFVR